MEHSFRYWLGKSGKRYLHTIRHFDEWPDCAAGNVIFVRRLDHGRKALWIGLIQRLAYDATQELVLRMMRLGANEIHVHLLACSLCDCEEISRDLRAACPAMRVVDPDH